MEGSKSFQEVLREKQKKYDYFVGFGFNGRTLKKITDELSDDAFSGSNTKSEEKYFLENNVAYLNQGKIKGADKRAEFFTEEEVYEELLKIHQDELTKRLSNEWK